MADGSVGHVDFGGLVRSIVTSNRPSASAGATGGYPDDIFLDLTEEERHTYECNICLLVVKDPRQCSNSHLFCGRCIFTWTLSSNGENSLKCPVCRAPGRYKPDFRVDYKLGKKRTKCIEPNCNWNGYLSCYEKHRKEKHCEVSKSETDSDDFSLPLLISPTRRPSYDGRTSVTSEREIPSPAQRMLRPTRTERMARGRRRLSHMLDSFGHVLEQRQRNISSFQTERERVRQDQMNEVENLGRQLDEVSNGLMNLLTDMQWDGNRYRDYIQASEDLDESLTELRNITEDRLQGDHEQFSLANIPSPTVSSNEPSSASSQMGVFYNQSRSQNSTPRNPPSQMNPFFLAQSSSRFSSNGQTPRMQRQQTRSRQITSGPEINVSARNDSRQANSEPATERTHRMLQRNTLTRNLQRNGHGGREQTHDSNNRQ